MSPSEELKAAAEEIREVATGTTPGPWGIGNDTTVARKVEQLSLGSFTCLQVVADTDIDGRENWTDDDPDYVETRSEDDAAHIALWDPPTALLVADLLDGMAAHWATRPIADLDIYLSTPLCKLARHILGGAS